MYNVDDVLYNFISPYTGRILCETDYIFRGNEKKIAIPYQTILLKNLPDLEYYAIWQGDSNNRPQPNMVLRDTKFIIQQTNSSLPNAENLDGIGFSTSSHASELYPLPGIAKVEIDGRITAAIPGYDYVSPFFMKIMLEKTKTEILTKVKLEINALRAEMQNLLKQ